METLGPRGEGHAMTGLTVRHGVPVRRPLPSAGQWCPTLEEAQLVVVDIEALGLPSAVRGERKAAQQPALRHQ